jgi:ABC-type lipoprotein release transport system permease subunit
MINLKLMEYALLSIKRYKEKFIFITIIFTLLITFCSVVFIITGALRKEASYTLNNLPDIIVQRQLAGHRQFIESDRVDRIIEINGVERASVRVWGYYNFEYLNTNMTIVGIDPFGINTSKALEQITFGFSSDIFMDGKSMITGEKFHNLIKEIYASDSFNFRKPDGKYVQVKNAGVFKSETQLASTGTIIMGQDLASEILGIPEGKAADIAVKVANPQEVVTISEKIKMIYPDVVTVNKDIIEASYQNMFDYKGGIFLLFFLTSGLTFFIIIYDKTSGLSSEEKREIAVLKAVGWKISDIIKIKFYESAIVSLTAFISGTALSLFYVYILDAPGLKNIFMGYSYLKPQFDIPFHIDPTAIAVIFFVTIPLYTASIVIPSWKASVIDAEEIIR